jgi:hypothetical protein
VDMGVPILQGISTWGNNYNHTNWEIEEINLQTRFIKCSTVMFTQAGRHYSPPDKFYHERLLED